jgi:hypothetical protein
LVAHFRVVRRVVAVAEVVDGVLIRSRCVRGKTFGGRVWSAHPYVLAQPSTSAHSFTAVAEIEK